MFTNNFRSMKSNARIFSS